MKTKIYEINKNGIKEFSELNIAAFLSNESSTYLVGVQTRDRSLASNAMDAFNTPPEIIESMKNPESNIRFEYFDDSLYGELAYYSFNDKRPNFTGIIIKKNIVFAIHDDNEGLMDDLKKSICSFSANQLAQLTIEYLLYIYIVELLSKYGKLILSTREEIENMAGDIDKKNTDISPSDFLDAKSQLSGLSRVLEKLFFTLSFPPARDLLNANTPYRIYFGDLQKNLGLINRSLTQTEERLNSLNDHYQLLLQDKSNKRLNFLTIVQAIFVPLTLIAGIYGMNFEYIPLLNLKSGYLISIGFMVTIAIVFIWYFYKHDWF